MLHQVTKPTPCREGACLFSKPEEDTAEGARIGVKFKEWCSHLKVGEEVPEQNTPWDGCALRGQG